MKLYEYVQYDGLGLAELVRNGEVTDQELSELALSSIDVVNQKLNAVIDVYEDRAHSTDAQGYSGSEIFCGVPFILKDCGTGDKGRPQQYGSRLAIGHVCQSDSYLTQRYKRSGLKIIGRSAMPEFAFSGATESRLYGVTRNPWNPEKIPGGSSGGSAAAVASGIVPIAHGTDTGGSIRLPAFHCGLVGLKPGRSRVSKGPNRDETLFGGLDTEHVLTRTVRDSAAALDVACGAEHGDAFYCNDESATFLSACKQAVKPLRVAVNTGAEAGVNVDQEVIHATQSIASYLDEMGHLVYYNPPPVPLDSLRSALLTVWRQSIHIQVREIAAVTYFPIDDDHLEPVILEAYEEGAKITANQWFDAMTVFRQTRNMVAEWFDDFDIYLSPSGSLPQAGVGMYTTATIDDTDAFMTKCIEIAPFTMMFNITGQPAISLPLASTIAGLPIGMQFVAKMGCEDLLYSLSSFLEEAMPWKDRRPMIHVASSA